MDKVVAQRWVNALRSGEYRQTDGALQNDSGFCCLGVLCDLAVKDGVIPPPRVDDETEVTLYGGPDELADHELPPTSVHVWSGLNPKTTYVIPELGLEETLYGLNDDRGFDFRQIADVIEREYL